VKCQVCGEAEATIHFKELKYEEMQEMHLCPACAEEKGFHSMVEMEKNSLTSKLIFMPRTSPRRIREGGADPVPFLRPAVQRVRPRGPARMSACYTAFDLQLRRLMRRVHGSTRHAGKTPVVHVPSATARFNSSACRTTCSGDRGGGL